MNDVLKAVDLSKRFRRTEALDHLDLAVPEGSIYGLVGPNGAGKTTAIKTVMNIFRPTGGSVEVLGVDSRRLGPHEFAQIGYVSENQEIPEWMTVAYFMNYLKPFYPTWDNAFAAELLHQFDLPMDRKLKHLSRGMRMKAALASSLAYRPKLIVLDEPFTGLDPLVRDELIEGLLDSAESTTILISSHDHSAAAPCRGAQSGLVCGFQRVISNWRWLAVRSADDHRCLQPIFVALLRRQTNRRKTRLGRV